MGGNYSKNYCVSLGTSEQGDNRSQSQIVGRVESIVLFVVYVFQTKENWLSM